MKLQQGKYIGSEEYANKGIRTKTNPLGLDVASAQRAFDELSMDVIIPKFNELVSAFNVNATSITTEVDKKLDKHPTKVLSDVNFSLYDKGLVDTIQDKVTKEPGKFLTQNNYTDYEADLVRAIPLKVDRISGKSLSTYDYNQYDKDQVWLIPFKADKTDVLSKSANTPYSPTAAYNPTTKLYVDNTIMQYYNQLKNEVNTNYVKANGEKPVEKMTIGVRAAESAAGIFSFVQGEGIIASGDYSHAEGKNMDKFSVATAAGLASHVEGVGCKALNEGCHAEGLSTEATGLYSHSEGNFTEAIGKYGHAQNCNTRCEGRSSSSMGELAAALGDYSLAGGYMTIAKKYQWVAGKFNNVIEGPTSATDASGALFIIGNGTGVRDKTNAFVIQADGQAIVAGAISSSGADYAEFFEWDDLNAENEDRIGRFVTLEGEKIRLANGQDDYILGVISSCETASVIGDNYDGYWKDKYLRDIFGRRIIKEKTIAPHTDEDGDFIEECNEAAFELNPEYDPDSTYVPRRKRKEWDAVGMLGKLILKDDGSCVVNGYCRPKKDGIATLSNSGYRVIARVNNEHIKVIFK